MRLPTVEVVEVHYWAVLIRDEHRPHGEEYPDRFTTKAKAEAKADKLAARQIATPAVKYIVEFYAGAFFGGWTQSSNAPEAFATRQQAENKIAELKGIYPTRGYQVNEIA